MSFTAIVFGPFPARQWSDRARSLLYHGIYHRKHSAGVQPEQPRAGDASRRNSGLREVLADAVQRSRRLGIFFEKAVQIHRDDRDDFFSFVGATGSLIAVPFIPPKAGSYAFRLEGTAYYDRRRSHVDFRSEPTSSLHLLIALSLLKGR
jgi:hypothetical protein